MKHHMTWLVILSCSAFAAANVLAQGKTIGQAEAVKVAERFIARHGYNKKLRADLPPISTDGSADHTKVKPSKMVHSKAVKALIMEENGRRFWSVQFLFRQQQANSKYDFGREVRVSLNGREASMQNTSIAISKRFVDSVEER